MGDYALGAKIIGYAYVVWHDDMFAADLYEGNFVKYPDGNTDSVDRQVYEKAYAQYQRDVEEGRKIVTAYEKNQLLNLNFKVPAATADPEAAEKEWYIREHPQAVPSFDEPEQEPEKKILFKRGGRRKKQEGIVCPACKTVNAGGQRFCGGCGAQLSGAHKEMRQEAPQAPPAWAVKETVSNTDRTDYREAGYVPYGENMPPWGMEDSMKKRQQKGKGLVIVVLFLIFAAILAGAAACAAYMVFTDGNSGVTYGTENKSGTAGQAMPAQQTGSHVVVTASSDIAANQRIEEEDLEGVILSDEQFARYSGLSTYVGDDGETKAQTLLLWKDRENIIGKYAAFDLYEGSILYDTSITGQHVIADKTYVDAVVDGEEVAYEAGEGIPAGNTKVQIVALVSTDGAEPVRVLLSELMLADRSLQSIFDSAGQDILKMLAGQDAGSQETEAE